MKKTIIITIIALLLLTTINNTNAVMTYVGVRIDNLTDDPANSCAGVAGYGPQGRIRAIAAIQPNYPIYFNLSIGEAEVWTGNSTEDTDYTIGDTMYLPNAIDMTIGWNYNLTFDIDALRIYLPLQTSGTFIQSPSDNYYTIGNVANLGSGFSSISTACGYSGTYGGGGAWPTVFSDRTLSVQRNVMDGNSDFKIDGKYNGLSGPTVGNFNIQFTYN